MGGGILFAIATISIRKIRKNHTKPSTTRQELGANEPSTIRQELAANEPFTIRQELAANEHLIELPASINPAELLDHHKDRTELQ